MPKLQKTKEVAGGSEMIGEDIKTEVSLEELRKITWDYSKEDIVGLYRGEVVRGFMWAAKELYRGDVIGGFSWKAKEYGDVDLLMVTRCNVADGWVEHFECDEEPHSNPLRSKLKLTKDGEPVRTEVLCKVVVELLDSKGNVIVTLR